MRLRTVLAGAAVAALGGLTLAPASEAHDGGAHCEGSFLATGGGPVVGGTRAGHGEGGCTTAFQGFPLGVIGIYEAIDSTTGAVDDTAPAEIHVEVWLTLTNGTRRKYTECTDGNPAVPGGSARFGTARCELETNGETGQPLDVPEPLPKEIVRVECLSHSHARVKDGTAPVGRFGCYSTDAAEDALRQEMQLPPADSGQEQGSALTQSGESLGLPTGPPAEITAVPSNTYFPTSVIATPASRVEFANLDLGVHHDVVALEATRPAGSAPWCSQERFVGGCPLFYTPLILGAPGATALVEGLADAPADDYLFYCTIHTDMTGTITVVEP